MEIIMTPENIKEICNNFYPSDKISALKELGNRLIIEFKNLAENPEKTETLK